MTDDTSVNILSEICICLKRLCGAIPEGSNEREGSASAVTNSRISTPVAVEIGSLQLFLSQITWKGQLQRY